jgi:anti-sigma regulatory factor (Ser/Thr protein kinase)
VDHHVGVMAWEVSASSKVLLPHAPSSVGAARHRLGADLRAHGVAEDSVADASLVLSELMSNAIRHAHALPGAQVQVVWNLGRGKLEMAVTDGGAPTEPHPVHHPPSAPAQLGQSPLAQSQLALSQLALGGRGLSIVEHMSRRWGVRHDEVGTTVWALLPVHSAGRSARTNGGTRRRPQLVPARSRSRPGAS